MSMSSHAAEPNLNATPLIDVLLVLLVMLIFTIPVMTHSVNLDMPKTGPRGAPPQTIALDIDFDGTILWNGSRVDSIASLESRLRAAQAQVPAPDVLLDSDPRARYETAALVLAATQRAHVRKLRIVSLEKL
jgi:biopolymer transport protein ExbD